MGRDWPAIIDALQRKADDGATPAGEREALLSKVSELRMAHPEAVRRPAAHASGSWSPPPDSSAFLFEMINDLLRRTGAQAETAGASFEEAKRRFTEAAQAGWDDDLDDEDDDGPPVDRAGYVRDPVSEALRADGLRNAFFQYSGFVVDRGVRIPNRPGVRVRRADGSTFFVPR